MVYDGTSFFLDHDQNLKLLEDLFDPIDVHFARFMMQLAGSKSSELALAAAVLSMRSRQGHTCLDLMRQVIEPLDDEISALQLPEGKAWIKALRKEPVVGHLEDYCPLILDDAGRLYLHRAFENERRLAGALLHLNAQVRPFDHALFRKGLERMFPSNEGDGYEGQKIAGVAALSRGLCVITGGPGTGKTTLVANILALLLEQERHLKISLAAPTGKAARRIEESIQRSLDLLDCQPEIRAMIPREATTIHRLLKFSQRSPLPRHGEGNPVGADVVLIDEASMADLALMSSLVAALREGARLILLGDKNQLASVEAGYVLGDICDVGNSHSYSSEFASLVSEVTGLTVSCGGTPGIQDSIVELKKTYRFSSDSGIRHLSIAVNAGDQTRCLDIARSSSYTDLSFKDLPRPRELKGQAKARVLEGYGSSMRTEDIQERFKLFESFRVLCPIREGPYGVKAVNGLIETILAEEGLIRPGSIHYPGRPVLITANDYTLRLFNGDIGLIISDGGDLRACFQDKDGSIRKISPLRLPSHETAFAMTVHKSQGSEFERVLFVLPDRDYPVLTRELVYTAITRARNSIEIWTHDEVFAAAVARRTQRSSGLNSLLWRGP